MINSNCMKIITELQSYKEPSCVAYAKCVESRLNDSTLAYAKDMKNYLKFISHKNTLQVLRVMNRIDKL